MSNFTQGAGFRICGTIVRRYVPQSRKIAFLTLDVTRSPRNVKMDLRTFDQGLIDEIDSTNDGALVEVTGTIDVEAVKDKTGKELLVDGYKKWVPALTVKAMHVSPSSKAADDPKPDDPAPADEPANPEDDVLF